MPKNVTASPPASQSSSLTKTTDTALNAGPATARDWLILLEADTDAPNQRQVAKGMQRLIAKRGQNFAVDELETALGELKANPPETPSPARTPAITAPAPARGGFDSRTGPRRGWDIVRPEDNAIRQGILWILKNPGQPLASTNNGQARQITPLLKKRYGITVNQETVRKHLCAIRPKNKIQHSRGALAKAVKDRLVLPKVKALSQDQRVGFLAKLIEEETGIPTSHSAVWRILEGQKSREDKQRTEIHQLRQEATLLRRQNTRLKASNAKLLRAPTSTRAVSDRNKVLSRKQDRLKAQNKRLKTWNKRGFDALRACFDELMSVLPLRYSNRPVPDPKKLEMAARLCYNTLKVTLPGRGYIKKKRRKQGKQTK